MTVSLLIAAHCFVVLVGKGLFGNNYHSKYNFLYVPKKVLVDYTLEKGKYDKMIRQRLYFNQRTNP